MNHLRNYLNKMVTLLKTKSKESYLIGWVSALVTVVVIGAYIGNSGVYHAEAINLSALTITEEAIPLSASLELEDSHNRSTLHLGISRDFLVTVEVDNSFYSLNVTGGTVSDIVQQLEIHIGEDDIITPSMEENLSRDLEIKISRVTYQDKTVTEEIPFTTEYRDTSVLRNGKQRVIHEGVNGTLESTYQLKFVDGVEVESTLLTQTTTKEPVEQVIIVGKEGTPISDLDFGYTLDENGVPTQYKEVLTNQVATAYNAGKRAWGASGMELFYGYVATRADQIPYGTKMYITSADNSFVYGYAIAADTGIGLMENIIDVDLYYETFLESCLNGRQNVNIYILD